MSGFTPKTCTILQTFGFSLLLLSCGGGHPPANVSGSWSGTVIDSAGHTGSASLTLSQHSNVLSGTFSYATSICTDDNNAVSGTISGMQVSLTKTPSDAYNISLLLTLDPSSTKLSGTYNQTSGVCGSTGTAVFTK